MVSAKMGQFFIQWIDVLKRFLKICINWPTTCYGMGSGYNELFSFKVAWVGIELITDFKNESKTFILWHNDCFRCLDG